MKVGKSTWGMTSVQSFIWTSSFFVEIENRVEQVLVWLASRLQSLVHWLKPIWQLSNVNIIGAAIFPDIQSMGKGTRIFVLAAIEQEI